MSFVINTSEWDFNGKDAATVAAMLEQLLERIDVAIQRAEQVYIGAELQSHHVCGEMDLWAFLYDPSMEEIDSSILGELAAVLNNVECYEDIQWPPNFPEEPVFDSNGDDVGLDLSFAHFSNLARQPMACITLHNQGATETKSKFGSADIPLINDENSHKSFWRVNALAMLRDTAGTLEALSPNMYPNLHFYERVWKGMSDFQGGYPRASYKLKKYLECLDDYGHWVFTAPPPALHPTDTIEPHLGLTPSNELIESRFAGMGITMAPEKANVRNDKDKYAARAIDFKLNPDGPSTELYCEWHGKLEGHTNRVHIHPPLAGVVDKVVIAIFHKHL
ncbi:TPA: hypothetical protein ACOLYF_002766 [Vibrio parahaemolyticus]|nr:hypothetical protein [Vibrio parahaemolyticus]